MSKKAFYISGSIAVLALVAAGTAFAATGTSVVSPTKIAASIHSNFKGGSHALMATVTAVSGTTLTVTARGNNAAVTTIDASKAEVMVAGAKATAAGIKTGDRVIALGSASGSTFTATRISDGAAATADTSGPLTGTVTAVSGSSITLSVKQHSRAPGKSAKNSVTTASLTVTTGPKTIFSVPGIKKATISNVTVGGTVTVIGVNASTGAGTAHLVSVAPAKSSKK